MFSVREDFKKRAKEIFTYNKFISIIVDSYEDPLTYEKNGLQHSYKISDELEKVLIANGFLLLYNIVEATIRNLIERVYDEINNENLCLRDLSGNIQKIWLKQQTHNIRKGTQKYETLHKLVCHIADDVLLDNKVKFEKDKLDFSGNLDAKKIKELAADLGVEQPHKNGEDLLTIKNKRNHLAHGNYSFAEIGKDYTTGDLNAFSKSTYLFLLDVIDQYQRFIDELKFINS